MSDGVYFFDEPGWCEPSPWQLRVAKLSRIHRYRTSFRGNARSRMVRVLRRNFVRYTTLGRRDLWHAVMTHPAW